MQRRRMTQADHKKLPSIGWEPLWNYYFGGHRCLSFLYGLRPMSPNAVFDFEVTAMPNWWWSSIEFVFGLSLAMLFVSLV